MSEDLDKGRGRGEDLSSRPARRRSTYNGGGEDLDSGYGSGEDLASSSRSNFERVSNNNGLNDLRSDVDRLRAELGREESKEKRALRQEKEELQQRLRNLRNNRR